MRNLFSKIEGQGPNIILLHGLFGSGGNLGAIARSLRTDYCLHNIDLRNHGKSFHSKNMNLELMAEDISRYCQEHKLTQVSLLGHSLGGKMAMQVALDYPDLVHKLVVANIAPVLYASRHDKVFTGLKAVASRSIASRSAAEAILTDHVNDAGIRSFLLKSLAKNADGGYQWRFNLEGIPKNYAELSKGNSGNGYIGPSLFIRGADSDYILPEHQSSIEVLFPNAEYKIMAGTGYIWKNQNCLPALLGAFSATTNFLYQQTLF